MELHIEMELGVDTQMEFGIEMELGIEVIEDNVVEDIHQYYILDSAKLVDVVDGRDSN
jgi:hypothetical protein